MEAIRFEDLPKAMAELTAKVDELFGVIKNVQPTVKNEQYLTIEETAEFLSLSRPTIYSKVAKREIPHMKRGKRLYFLREDLETYLKGGRVKTINEIEADAGKFLTSKKKGVKNE